MRIIAGNLKGRNFDSPKGHRTHPMSDKMRGALFNALGDIHRLTVLDAFAGSGAVGFEALSRGAEHITAVELDKDAYKTIRKNAETLGIKDKVDVVNARVSGWSLKKQHQTFDVIICDPPYDNLQITALQKLVRHMKPNSIYVLSWPGKEDLPLIPKLEILRQKGFGDSQLIFYKVVTQPEKPKAQEITETSDSELAKFQNRF
jgi:16S rRNA (guanine966-N2)-methyltransferase